MQALLVIYKLVNQVLSSSNETWTINLPDHKDIDKEELSKSKFIKQKHELDPTNNKLIFKNIDENSEETLTIQLSDDWTTSDKTDEETLIYYLMDIPNKKRVEQFTYQKGQTTVTFDKYCSLELDPTSGITIILKDHTSYL